MFRFGERIENFTESVPKLMARLKENTKKNFPKYMMMIVVFGQYCPELLYPKNNECYWVGGNYSEIKPIAL